MHICPHSFAAVRELRVGVVGATDFTYRGRSNPLRCLERMTCMSLPRYYLSNGVPAEGSD